LETVKLRREVKLRKNLRESSESTRKAENVKQTRAGVGSRTPMGIYGKIPEKITS